MTRPPLELRLEGVSSRPDPVVVSALSAWSSATSAGGTELPRPRDDAMPGGKVFRASPRRIDRCPRVPRSRIVAPRRRVRPAPEAPGAPGRRGAAEARADRPPARPRAEAQAGGVPPAPADGPEAARDDRVGEQEQNAGAKPAAGRAHESVWADRAGAPATQVAQSGQGGRPRTGAPRTGGTGERPRSSGTRRLAVAGPPGGPRTDRDRSRSRGRAARPQRGTTGRDAAGRAPRSEGYGRSRDQERPLPTQAKKWGNVARRGAWEVARQDADATAGGPAGGAARGARFSEDAERDRRRGTPRPGRPAPWVRDDGARDEWEDAAPPRKRASRASQGSGTSRPEQGRRRPSPVRSTPARRGRPSPPWSTATPCHPRWRPTSATRPTSPRPCTGSTWSSGPRRPTAPTSAGASKMRCGPSSRWPTRRPGWPPSASWPGWPPIAAAAGVRRPATSRRSGR